mgnify:CR=1 FL=1
MDDRTPVLLDTDIGSDIDDALALAYLLAERRCNLLGVSTVSGEAGKRAMLADAVCQAAGRPDVPVWSGADKPLVMEQQQREAPQAEVLGNWEHREDFEPNTAVLRMREVIRNYPGDIALITVGPLTNIGLLFSLDPQIPAMIDRLIIMGGTYVNPPGREWNVSCDPHAAAIAFGADVAKIRAYGLDVTTQCKMNAADCRDMISGGPLDLVAEMAEVWFRERDEITFHDPLAACCAFEPETCTYRHGQVQVEWNDRERMGHTSFEEQTGGKHGVADDVNVQEFFDRFFGTVEVFKE